MWVYRFDWRFLVVVTIVTAFMEPIRSYRGLYVLPYYMRHVLLNYRALWGLQGLWGLGAWRFENTDLTSSRAEGTGSHLEFRVWGLEFRV